MQLKLPLRSHSKFLSARWQQRAKILATTRKHMCLCLWLCAKIWLLLCAKILATTRKHMCLCRWWSFTPLPLPQFGIRPSRWAMSAILISFPVLYLYGQIQSHFWNLMGTCNSDSCPQSYSQNRWLVWDMSPLLVLVTPDAYYGRWAITRWSARLP